MPKRTYSKRQSNTVQINGDDDYIADGLVLTSENLQITGDKGYRSARVTHYVSSGTWYCECQILTSKDPNAHVRLGFETLKCNINTPVGYEKMGYGYRDIDGSKINNSKREFYGRPFKSGDIVGMLISFPGSNTVNINQEINTYNKSKEILQEIRNDSKIEEDTTVPGSYIEFYVNGVSQGKAFENLYEGKYYATISLYMHSVVRLNPGPVFIYSPKNIHLLYLPLSKLVDSSVEDTISKQRKLDIENNKKDTTSMDKFRTQQISHDNENDDNDDDDDDDDDDE